MNHLQLRDTELLSAELVSQSVQTKELLFPFEVRIVKIHFHKVSF